MTEATDVLVIGAGPAGLSAAIELRRRTGARVVVVDREERPGGAPRFSHHRGYGLVDLHRPLSGPEYSGRLAGTAASAGAELRSLTSAVGWSGERRVETTGPSGLSEIEARAVVLATGCRERGRGPRLVPGSRPATGVLTTGSLQQLVDGGRHVGARAVVFGAEHVSLSAVMTLRRAGAGVVALVTEHPRHQTSTPLLLAATGLRRVPIRCGARLTRILGRERVEAVEITSIESGATAVLECDAVVFTGGWVPENELARLQGLELDPGTRGPRVDPGLRTSAPGVFAAGNALHGAEPSFVAAREGRRVARAVAAWLDSGVWPSSSPVPVHAADPVAWVFPNAVRPGDAIDATGFTLRVARFVEGRALEVRQGRRLLWRGPASVPRRGARLVPNRSIRIPGTWLAGLGDDGEVTVSAPR